MDEQKKDLGKISIKRDEFKEEYGDGSFVYEFNYNVPGFEDDSKYPKFEAWARDMHFHNLVRNFAIKLRVNIYGENESGFDENSKLEDVMAVANTYTAPQDIKDNFEITDGEWENTEEPAAEMPTEETVDYASTEEASIHFEDTLEKESAIEEKAAEAESEVEKFKYEIEARIEFDIDNPFIVESENKNEAIKHVLKYCMEKFNIPSDAVVFKSILSEEEKADKERAESLNKDLISNE